MDKGKGSKISKISILMLILLAFSIISSVSAQQDLKIVLIRAQYSTLIGGHNEPVRDVLIDYKILDSEEWFSVITNENGQSYIALEEGSSYELKIQYNGSQEQFLLEFVDEDILMISIDMNNKNIVDCSFISPSTSKYFDLPFFSFLNFTLHISHVISFFLGLILSIILIRVRINKWRKQI